MLLSSDIPEFFALQGAEGGLACAGFSWSDILGGDRDEQPRRRYTVPRPAAREQVRYASLLAVERPRAHVAAGSPRWPGRRLDVPLDRDPQAAVVPQFD